MQIKLWGWLVNVWSTANVGGQDENNLFSIKLTMTLSMSLLFRGAVERRLSELISDEGDLDN